MASKRANYAGLMSSASTSRNPLSRLPTTNLLTFLLLSLLLLSFPSQTTAIKFILPAHRHTSGKCIWNPVHDNQLVIVTANVGPGEKQRVDIEIVDSSPKRNVYLSKKNIGGETRLAVTTHAEGEVGVCLKNTLIEGGEKKGCGFERGEDDGRDTRLGACLAERCVP